MISGINIKKNEKVSIKDMSVLAKEIINYLECKEYKILNDILKTFNFNDTNGTIIIGIVRYTYCERKKLPQWKWFLEKAIAELDSRNAIHSLRSINF